MRLRIRGLWGLWLLTAGAGALSGPAAAQAVAKATFLSEGSFSLPVAGQGALKNPMAIAWAPGDEIHVAGEEGPVAVFDGSGSFVRSYGGGLLKKVASLAVDTEGRAYVLDSDDRTILVFDASGEGVHRIGSRGDGAGQLDDPVDVAVGPGGLVYVLDKGRGGVQVFSLDGTFIHDLLLPEEAEDGRALAVGRDGGVYVTAKGLPDVILRLPSLPEALNIVDTPSPELERFRLRGADLREPTAIVVTPTGTVLAGDRDSGLFWSADATGAEPVGADDRVYGGKGSGRGSFRRLVDAALAGPDEMVMLDRDEGKVERVQLALEGDRSMEEALDYPVRFQSVSPALDPGVLAMAPTSRGTVWYAVVDAEGRGLRVVEAEMTERTGVFGERIRLPEPVRGKSLHSFGGLVERAGGAALDDTLLVVTEPRENRFHVFDLRTDQSIGSFGDNYRDDRRLRSPRGVAIFPDGRIAVADNGNERIAIFSADVATLLATLPLTKAEGVTVSAEGRLFAWSEDGGTAGEFPLDGGAMIPLPSTLATGAGVGALTIDAAGNVYALRRGSGRVVVADASMARTLARVGGDADLEGGDRLTVDVDGNIYATDLERGRTQVLRWGVDVPPVGAVTATWGLGFTQLDWQAQPGSFVTGFVVEGATSREGPWAGVAATETPRMRLEAGENHWFRVSARTLTGAVGRPSPPVAALHLAAMAAFDDGRWGEARSLGRDALALIDAGEVRADPAVANALAWRGFVAAHEGGDWADVLAWDEVLGDGVPADQAFDHAYRLADAYQQTGDIEAATDRALEAVRVLGPMGAGASTDRLDAMRRMVFENGMALERWSDVAAAGEALLDVSDGDPDPAFVASLVRAHLKVGSARRARELAESGMEAAGSRSTRRTFAVLSFLAAAEVGDMEAATAYADVVQDSVPAELFVEFEAALTRMRVSSGNLAGARSELLFFLLGQEDDIRALADPEVSRTVLRVFGGLVESGDAQGGRQLLDTLVAAIPPDLADAGAALRRQADSVAVVADTRAKLGEGFGFYRDALFRDALRFFQEADARTDLDVDQRLMVKEILAGVFHSLGRIDDADGVFRQVYDVDPDFVLDDHLAHVEALYGLTIYTEDMLEHFRSVGPIM